MRARQEQDKQQQQDACDCAICLQPFAATDCLFTGPCKHTFHIECAEADFVVGGRAACPLCRAPFAHAAGMVALQRASFNRLGSLPVMTSYGMTPMRGYGAIPSPAMTPRRGGGRVRPSWQPSVDSPRGASAPIMPDFPLSYPTDATAAPPAAAGSPPAAAAPPLSEAFASVSIVTDVASVATQAAAAASSLPPKQAVTSLVRVSFADDDNAHPCCVPGDFVILADVSGSMTGRKIAAVRDALLKLSEGVFGARDRVALIFFNDRAAQATALAPLGSEQHRAAFRNAAMTRCVASGGTDIAEALELAFAVLDGRAAHRNPLQQVLLLSDGQDGRAAQALEALLAQRQGRPGGDVVVTSLGFGADHDAELLASLASRGRGSFTYVERAEVLDEVLAAWQGDATRVLAGDCRVELAPGPGARVVRVQGPGVVGTPDPATGAVTVDLHYARVDASAQLLVDLEVARPAGGGGAAAAGGAQQQQLEVLKATVTARAIGGDAATGGGEGAVVAAAPAVATLAVRDVPAGEGSDGAAAPEEERSPPVTDPEALREIAVARNRDVIASAAAAVAAVLEEAHGGRGGRERAADVVAAARESLQGDNGARAPAAAELDKLLQAVQTCEERVATRLSSAVCTAMRRQHGLTPSAYYSATPNGADAEGGASPPMMASPFYKASKGAMHSSERMRVRKAAGGH